ncbi:response regulator [Paenibacillus sp. SN-8-1]|uniref:response regulator n=1 Tax=Paenibacillus sp. SN-8-1 TaxID=3435409 RepID=UPI003D9AA9DB
MRTMIIDSDESELELLETLLTGYRIFEIVEKQTRPEQVLETVLNKQVEVVFLEIQLPLVNGLLIAESLLQTAAEIKVVFVTKHNHLAIEAFEIGVLDYILKPLEANRLHKTVNRLLVRHEAGRGPGRILTSDFKELFFCFGKFEWISNRQSMAAVRWRRSKERELMALFLHYRGQFVSKERIMEGLWPETSPEQAVAFLHSCVYNIRKMIKECNAVLEYHNNRYRFEMQEAWFDAEVFEQMVESSMRINSANVNVYENIADLYRGDYLEQEEFEWAREKRENMKKQYIFLLKKLAEFYLSENRLQEAERCLRKALQKNPYLDDMNELLLKVYTLQGDRYAMIRHFNEFITLLNEDLGIAPKESTFQLYQQLSFGIFNEVEKIGE